MQSTSGISPAGSVGATAPQTNAPPGSIPFTRTTTASTTNVTLLSITGSGSLRFLGTGHSTTSGGVTLTVTADGRTVLNDAVYAGNPSGIAQSPLAVAVHGGISMMHDGTSFHYLPVPEDGFTFNTSLTIQARVTSGTAYVGWSYRLYA